VTLVESSYHPTIFGDDHSPGLDGDRDKQSNNSYRRQSALPAHLARRGKAVCESSLPAVPDAAVQSAETSHRLRQADKLKYDAVPRSGATTTSPRRLATCYSSLRLRHQPEAILSGRTSLNSTVANPIDPIRLAEERGRSDDQLKNQVTNSELSNVLSDRIGREGMSSEQRHADDNGLLVDEILVILSFRTCICCRSAITALTDKLRCKHTIQALIHALVKCTVALLVDTYGSQRWTMVITFCEYCAL